MNKALLRGHYGYAYVPESDQRYRYYRHAVAADWFSDPARSLIEVAAIRSFAAISLAVARLPALRRGVLDDEVLTRRAVHLGGAAQRVGVLHTRVVGGGSAGGGSSTGGAGRGGGVTRPVNWADAPGAASSRS